MPKAKCLWLPALLILCLTASFFPFQALPDGSKAVLGTVAVVDYQPEPAGYESAVEISGGDYSGRQWAIPKIMAPSAWDITYGECGIVIAVLDTGIDKNHEDLAGKVISEVNFTDSRTTRDA